MYKKGHIHFVGIGGVGMSGIAKILKAQGYTISGCDTDVDQQIVNELRFMGCEIYHGNNSLNCKNNNIDVVVYSSAINQNSEEILNAQARGIPTIARALMLAEILRTKYSIAITGAHGKTTTTSIISHILIESKLDPTVIIGGILKSISTNARSGSGEFIVAEADESDKSFLMLYPTIAVVTNIDLEHLDTYKDIEDIKKTFKDFLSNIPFYGKAFVCVDDPYVRSILPLSHVKTIKYGESDLADIQARDIILNPENSEFSLYLHSKFVSKIKLNIPGKYNILNALAAIGVSLDIGISIENIAKSLESFSGVERRFSYKGVYKGAEFFDDYAHHPTEIFNAISVARRRAKKRLIVVFQPHRYSRTCALWSDFVNLLAYSPIDQLIITDIYAASESPIDNITSDKLVSDIKFKQSSSSVEYVSYDFELKNIVDKLEKICQSDDLVLLLGAGRMNKIADILIK